MFILESSNRRGMIRSKRKKHVNDKLQQQTLAKAMVIFPRNGDQLTFNFIGY